ncbi:MAG: RsmD family RNA methyltransferase [Deltaproteobacteria bacterium]|nr:RsmD family RNA methyltransferase [Deltaproteobacteria bacterium]
MRIISGRLRGLRFSGPLSSSTRPTPERVREGLASALETRGAFRGALVLDLFAGTGALSFEALSRGAERAMLIERNNRALKAIIDSANRLRIRDQIQVLSLDLLQNPVYTASRIAPINGKPFSLVFADPPYCDGDRLTPLLKELASQGHLSRGCFIAIEHATESPPQGIDELGRIDFYRYGDTAIALVHFA